MTTAYNEGLARLIHEFEHPAEEFSPMPFWFWNDTLTEEEILRQMTAFKEKGVDGFVIHPRLGLDPAIPYMGERWLSFVAYAVEQAERLGMRVMLYDEAMYPSGSCCGQVVVENPDFCAKGLKMADSPAISEGETLIAEAEWAGKNRYFILTPTRGTIRGAYFGQDDGQPDAHADVEAVVLVQHPRHVLHHRQGLGLGVDLGAGVVGNGLLLHGGQVGGFGGLGGGLAGFLYSSISLIRTASSRISLSDASLFFSR